MPDQPLHHRRGDHGYRAGVDAGSERDATVSGDIVQRDCRLKVRECFRQLSPEEQRDPQRALGVDERRAVVQSSSQVHELLAHLPCLVELRAHQVINPESKQHREQPLGATDPLAQLPRSFVQPLYLWRSVALRRRQGRAKSDP